MKMSFKARNEYELHLMRVALGMTRSESKKQLPYGEVGATSPDGVDSCSAYTESLLAENHTLTAEVARLEDQAALSALLERELHALLGSAFEDADKASETCISLARRLAQQRDELISLEDAHNEWAFEIRELLYKARPEAFGAGDSATLVLYSIVNDLELSDMKAKEQAAIIARLNSDIQNLTEKRAEDKKVAQFHVRERDARIQELINQVWGLEEKCKTLKEEKSSLEEQISVLRDGTQNAASFRALMEDKASLEEQLSIAHEVRLDAETELRNFKKARKDDEKLYALLKEEINASHEMYNELFKEKKSLEEQLGVLRDGSQNAAALAAEQLRRIADLETEVTNHECYKKDMDALFIKTFPDIDFDFTTPGDILARLLIERGVLRKERADLQALLANQAQRSVGLDSKEQQEPSVTAPPEVSIAEEPSLSSEEDKYNGLFVGETLTEADISVLGEQLKAAVNKKPSSAYKQLRQEIFAAIGKEDDGSRLSAQITTVSEARAAWDAINAFKEANA